jgi:Fe-S oxidoreductase
MADHGYPDAVVRLTDPAAQRMVWDMREACLNIMMSAPGDAKPVSFIEDCAVPLEHLADYTAAITDLFDRHGTRGTWYAHASVGCLHVRPILNLRDPRGMAAMRAIAEEACALVRRFKGSHSGEHGDGISRSEFHEAMFGAPLVRGFEAVKDAFDPAGLLNPGKIVRPYRMDDPALMRHRPGPTPAAPATGLDWSATGDLQGAAEMCNNNGTCRKLAGGAMCPSYRATRDEAHLTRGRANVLRLALTGHLGPDAISSERMKDSLSLCVGCKACRRECPTGVDMARMKIEVLHQYHAHHPRRMRDHLVGTLAVLAPTLSRLRWIANLRDRVPGVAALTDKWMGLTARRPLPRWQKAWDGDGTAARPDDIVGDGLDLVIFADTFTRHTEPEVPAAALQVLRAAGYRLHAAPRPGPARPLCCGRTRLAVGQTDEARAEARRTIAALSPLIARGARVVGVEPSCILTLRDEFPALLPGDGATMLAGASFMVEEVLEADLAQGRVALPLRDMGGRIAHLHGHCHQKAFGLMPGVESLLRRVPGLEVRPVDSSCCGMAGAFGYQSETYDVSMAMAELSLLPALRAAGPDDLVVADGTSCRSQIGHGTGKAALHVVQVLAQALTHRTP